MNIDDFVGKYWHELTAEEKKWLLTESHKTWGWLVANVKQPDWCGYPEALMGEWGCWSLMDFGDQNCINREFCKDCECYHEPG